MKTVTFYSYKGGTGRTLLLTNTALFLASAGKRVVMIDLDLEAPGLPYKFAPNNDREYWTAGPGIVEHLASYIRGDISEIDVPSLATTIPAIGSGSLSIITAGSAPSNDYLAALSGTDWHSFYWGRADDNEPAAGKWRHVFGVLKTQIREQLQPDYLLIDSRTGLADIAGVCLNVLPDIIVSLTLPRQETIDGTSWVLRKAKDAAAVERRTLRILSVVARVSMRQSVAEATEQLLACVPDAEPICLHTDPELEVRERPLFLDHTLTLRESALLRDYLVFFRCFDPESFAQSAIRDAFTLQDIIRPDDQPDTRVGAAPASSVGTSMVQRIKDRRKLRVADKRDVPNAKRFVVFCEAITDRLERFLEIDDCDRPPLSSVNYDLLGGQIRDGLFDFCAGAYPLTTVREQSAEVVQFGWLSTFLLVCRAGAHPPSPVSHRAANVEEALRPWLARTDDTLEIACQGEAASAESYRYLWAQNVAFLHNPRDIIQWLLEERTGRRIALVDHNVMAGIDPRKRREIAAQPVRIGTPLPVGFALPRGDREWRRIVVSLMAEQLEAIKWSDDWATIRDELREGAGIAVYDWDQCCHSLAMDMPLERAMGWLRSTARHPPPR